jgi:hypothetical protein
MSQELERVYVLCHYYTINSGDRFYEEDLEKRLYYSFDRAACEAEIAFYKDLPGFRDHPDGFKVMQIELECRFSESGFDTYFYTPE